MERARKVFGGFKKRDERPALRRTESEIIAAVIDRISVEGETDALTYPTQNESGATEEEYRGLLKRLRRQIRRAGITSDELVRAYNGPVNAILLLKTAERRGRKESSYLEERLGRLGFKHLQNGVWLLPPALTPAELGSHDDLKLWVHQNVTKPLGKEVQFVLPFVAVIDLKKVVAEKRGIRKLPLGKTIFNLLQLEEALRATQIYEHLKRRGLGIEEVISSGDLLFLTSSFCDESTMAALEESYYVVIQRLQRAVGFGQSSLEGVANLDPAVLTEALTDFVPHPRDTAQRTIVEAQFWMRFLGGSQTWHEVEVNPNTLRKGG